MFHKTIWLPNINSLAFYECILHQEQWQYHLLNPAIEYLIMSVLAKANFLSLTIIL